MTRLREVSPARLLAIVALIVALAFAPHDALSLWRNARNGQATPRATRELGPALDVGILAPNAVIAAARIIPANAIYYVAAGPAAPERTADAIPYVAPWATLNLLPRRMSPRIDEAQWLIAYGVDPSSLGVRVGPPTRVGPGVTVSRILR